MLLNSSKGDPINKLIFTAGAEGLIKAWNLPSLPKDEKYPQTNGRSFCVGTLHSEPANGEELQPYW